MSTTSNTSATLPDLGTGGWPGLKKRMINPYRIEAVLRATDTKALASRFTKLQHRGRAWVGRCPLHDEKTPSFYVNPNGKLHCFGCGWHGDAIDLLRAVNNLSFYEALEQLESEAGITPAREPTPEEIARHKQAKAKRDREQAEHRKLESEFFGATRELHACNREARFAAANYRADNSDENGRKLGRFYDNQFVLEYRVEKCLETLNQ